MAQQIYENILQTQNYTLQSQLNNVEMKICLLIKNQHHRQQTYEIEINSVQQIDELSQHFENLLDLKEYIKIQGHVKVNIHDKTLQILSKGPTKKSQKIHLATLHLKPKKCQPTFNGHYFNEKKPIILKQNQQWMDSLTDQILGIIQNQALETSRKQLLQEEFMKKSEVNQLIISKTTYIEEQLLKYKSQMEKIKLLLQKHNQKNQHLEQETSKIINIQQQIKNHQQKLDNLQNQKYQTISTQLQQLHRYMDKIPKLDQDKIQQMLRDQTSRLQAKLKQDIAKQIINLQYKCSSKEQIDAIIKKLQIIGTKIQNSSLQNRKLLEQQTKIRESLTNQNKKIQQIQTKLIKQNTNSIRSSTTVTKNPQILSLSPLNAEEWIDRNCAHFGRIIFDKNFIILKSFGGANLFSNQKISQKSSFNVSIQHITSKISIGIIDSQYNSKLILSDISSKISYENTKKLYNGKQYKQQQGYGYKIGDIVTVQVDLKAGIIIWKVGSDLKQVWQTDQLRNNKIVWVPYVHMHNQQDKIGIFI